MYHHANETARPMPEDSEGYAIPSADLLHDQLVECGLNDPNYGDASAWPWWVDLGRFELGGATEFIDLPGEDEDENPF